MEITTQEAQWEKLRQAMHRGDVYAVVRTRLDERVAAYEAENPNQTLEQKQEFLKKTASEEAEVIARESTRNPEYLSAVASAALTDWNKESLGRAEAGKSISWQADYIAAISPLSPAQRGALEGEGSLVVQAPQVVEQSLEKPIEERAIDIETASIFRLRAHEQALTERWIELASTGQLTDQNVTQLTPLAITIAEQRDALTRAIEDVQNDRQISQTDREILLRPEQMAEERERLIDRIVDGPDGLNVDGDYTWKQASKVAEQMVDALQASNPGKTYPELAQIYEQQLRAELHPSWDKPLNGPEEEAAKKELLELLTEKHTPWEYILSHDSYGEYSAQDFYDTAERKAGDDLDRMVRSNPNASYGELLATVEQKERAEGYDVGPEFPKNEVGVMPGFELTGGDYDDGYEVTQQWLRNEVGMAEQPVQYVTWTNPEVIGASQNCGISEQPTEHVQQLETPEETRSVGRDYEVSIAI